MEARQLELLTASDYAAMKTLLAIAAADITNARASLVSHAVAAAKCAQPFLAPGRTSHKELNLNAYRSLTSIAWEHSDVESSLG